MSKESEKIYELLFSTMLDGFSLQSIVCNELGKPVDFKFISVNPSFVKMTGLEPENIIEYHWKNCY
ncbi:hypothetical protein [Desulfosporosinus sp. FKB]|uniref:hypothetical protein n=1 Tax=Desulfosporosinus sp. FKB TaxID=1969835 RepID=UPI000B49ECCC|nr:hypothetical protein [Desulfosporosinus sp. FKB]